MSILSHTTKLMTAGLTSIVCLVAAQAQAQAKAFYVSPSGSGVGGTNWRTAWKDPAQIDWTVINPGDQILLDGGTSGITYQTSFTVPKSGTAGAPITIRQAPQAGHNGQVLLYGAADLYPRGYIDGQAVGIQLQGSYVNIAGARRSGIKIRAYKDSCISFGPAVNSSTVRNVEIENRISLPPYGQINCVGVKFTGYNNHFIDCDFRECQVATKEIAAAGANNYTVFRECTFGSTKQYMGFVRGCGTAIQSAATTSGAYQSNMAVNRCIFGPFITNGIIASKGSVRVSDSLFLAPAGYMIGAEPVNGDTTDVRVNQCTFIAPSQPFTPPYGMMGFAFRSNGTGVLRVANSIVYGSTISIPATMKVNAGGNFQYRVAGNTVALAPTLVDPQLTDEATVAAMPSDYVPYTLAPLNYAPIATSPAVGKGSRLVSISELTTPYGPTTKIPPLGGP
ncbi:MAG: hypothetical protein IPP57_06480 [Candidatus Obscuribacter sp.]|jgi:hypothetical protein|nr:hypothetical protein [Candidatus Obscuribacter sp.]MBK9201789.1 hypothetical protein [Candidatus Obscuribacter sp.]MBK9620077.1 hypothetical protein [Candidatus Obscuribacter sp.]MBK9770458.1 hypothetical protein [Candidatus Obscuribacter sp.]